VFEAHLSYFGSAILIDSVAMQIFYLTYACT